MKSHNYKKKQKIIRYIFIKIMSLRHDYYYIKKLIIKTHNKVIIMKKKVMAWYLNVYVLFHNNDFSSISNLYSIIDFIS